MIDQLLLIDGSSYIFRAFYGVRADLRNTQGFPTNAVFGFKNMLLQLLKQENPSHCIMVFDKPGPTFRDEIYSQYKANRDAAPDDLKVQFDPIYKLNELLNMPVISIGGFEADDIIGSLAKRFSSQIKVKIISGDKDLTQLVTNDVNMLDTMSNILYTPESVKTKFGVGPEMISEYLALIGDSSDNIPGASGIGPKTAVKLFERFGSIDGIYQNINRLKGKQKENLENSKENVDISRKLTVIDCDMELNVSLESFIRKPPELEGLKAFYQEMNFRADDFLKLHPEAKESGETEETSSFDRDSYELVTDKSRLQELQQIFFQQKELALDLETTSLHPIDARIVGLSFSWSGGTPVYIPVAHSENKEQIPLEEVLEILRPVFQKEDICFIGQNIKYEMMVLANYEIELRGEIRDTMIESYLLDANLHRHNLNDLADRHLQHKMIKYEDVVGKGKKQIPFADVALNVALRYAAEDVDATLRIHERLNPRLKEGNLEKLYKEVELPLCRTLARMERYGVKIDVSYLKVLCDKLRDDLLMLSQKIYLQAGKEFNINSTQQLGAVLFDDMGITIGKKKTKTGYSTDASVLEKIAIYEPIALDLLAYRTKNKLVNTYLNVLPSLINPTTGRIHTSYSQAVAATGRLSSNNPNLQNIPIKGKDGGKIRKAFIPDNGHVIVSADYSQIELRFLAHLSEDKGLIKVFEKGGDIHTETASAIYDTTVENVTSNQRRAAKAINFGIIYGMGAFRLSQEIGVPQKQAKVFIESYFAKYPGIKQYMDDTIAFCQEKYFVETMFHRKRAIPDIHSKNHIIRTACERVAINTRIQGSAADLIKIAMINIQNKLDSDFPNIKMIMQVHDELVFEMPEDDAPVAIPVIKEMMENSVQLRVPLVVDVGSGANWQEAH